MGTTEITTWTINSYYTLIIASIVLLFGRYLVRKYRFLQDFNIPEPVAGGLVAAVIIYALYVFNHVSFAFDKSLRDAFMLVFFSSIGLSADFSRLKAGGLPLIIFAVVVGIFIIIQNAVGVGLAVALDQNPLLGLVAGSITMTGGHGTAAGWGPDLEKIGLANATGLGIACATFGLVAGGLIGGPVARRLINKMKRQPLEKLDDGSSDNSDDTNDMFEKPERKRLITANSAIDTLAMFAACLAFAEIMDGIDKVYFKPVLAILDLPKCVWSLAFGVASLSLFLAMALLDLKLWELTALALPVTVILFVQVIVMALYATFITYVVMGRDYDAAVLAAGHCGFGLGATPTAVANMQSVTERFGPSHKAFLIVPMVGAFLVDLINAGLLQTFVKFIQGS